MQPLPRALRYLQLPPRRYKQHLTKLVPPEQKLGRLEWVLSRALYRFARFDLKTIPEAQRGRALELQIRQWSTYSNTGLYVVWNHGDALVWAWDADRITAELNENKLDAKRVKIIPETLLAQPYDDAVCVIACMDGFEGQIWQGDSLLASRWWPSVPESAEWSSFQRNAGLLPERQLQTVPAPIASVWQDHPWGKAASMGNTFGLDGKYEIWAIAVVTAALALATFWYAMQLVKLHQAHETRVAELKLLEQQAEPVREMRGQALVALARVKTLQTLALYPDQLSLMAKVAEILLKEAAYLKEWEYLGGKLKLVVTSPNKLVSSDYVRSFQAEEIFENVQALATADTSSLTLTMGVRVDKEIKLGGGVSAATASANRAIPEQTGRE